MCVAAFMWKKDSRFPFLLLLNRDEYYNRVTTPLGWWEDGVTLGGRDGEAGGTWLACTRNGRLAFVTNVREIKSNSRVKSRGELPLRFLKSEKNPRDFADELVSESKDYSGFNLLVADLTSLTMVYISNRSTNHDLFILDVPPGIHILSNASLDTPWPKTQRLLHHFEQVVGKFLESEISLQEMAETLMKDTTKDDHHLPGIYSPEFEYLLSSVFVKAIITPSGGYGTRSTSAVALNSSNGLVSFHESSMEEEEDEWKTRTISFQIQT